MNLRKKTVVQRCSVKNVFLEISQSSQENSCPRAYRLRPATLLKKRLWHRCFLVNFANFSIEYLCWLLL